MNFIPKIAEMLGVEIGEVFKVKYGTCGVLNAEYKITNGGLQERNHTGVWSGYNMFIGLTELLRGECEIIRVPWVPRDGEEVWWWGGFSNSANSYTFRRHSSECLSNWKLGLIFRTEEEAATKGRARWEELFREYERALEENEV